MFLLYSAFSSTLDCVGNVLLEIIHYYYYMCFQPLEKLLDGHSIIDT